MNDEQYEPTTESTLSVEAAWSQGLTSYQTAASQSKGANMVELR